MLSPAPYLVALALSTEQGSIEDELRNDRVQEAQNRHADEERRRDESLRQGIEREERERRAIEERIREFKRQEEKDAELRYQRDLDRRRREELRAADLDWQRDLDERTTLRGQQEKRLNEFFKDGVEEAPKGSKVKPQPPSPATDPKKKSKPPERPTNDPIFEI